MSVSGNALVMREINTNLALVATLVPDKSGQRRRKWLAFIVIELAGSPHKIHDTYRRRERLRFHRFTRLLIRSIEAAYGTVMSIPTLQPPESVIY